MRLILGALFATVLLGAAIGIVRFRGSPRSDRCTVGANGRSSASLDPAQAQNAAIIAAVGLGRRLPDHAVTIALAASLQETQLRNLHYGDRDSLGLFQQRPSQGWGSPAQLVDPTYAATAFYSHLSLIRGWQTMSVRAAAQIVQQSANPEAYAAWEAEARALARALTGEVPAGFACRLRHFDGHVPARSALSSAASKQFGSPVLGVSLPTKRGWQAAVWTVAHAFRYHVRSVSFAGREWTIASGRWLDDPSAGPVVKVTYCAGSAAGCPR